MRKLKTFMMMLAVCFAAIACEKEDNSLSNKEVYVGQQEMMGQQAEASYIVEYTNDNLATIVLPQIGTEGDKMYVPAMSVKDVKMVGERGNQTFNAPAFKLTTPAGMVLDYAKGITGTIKDGSLNLSYDMKPGEMPFALSITFTGALSK